MPKNKQEEALDALDALIRDLENPNNNGQNPLSRPADHTPIKNTEKHFVDVPAEPIVIPEERADAGRPQLLNVEFKNVDDPVGGEQEAVVRQTTQFKPLTIMPEFKAIASEIERPRAPHTVLYERSTDIASQTIPLTASFTDSGYMEVERDKKRPRYRSHPDDDSHFHDTDSDYTETSYSRKKARNGFEPDFSDADTKTPAYKRQRDDESNQSSGRYVRNSRPSPRAAEVSHGVSAADSDIDIKGKPFNANLLLAAIFLTGAILCCTPAWPIGVGMILGSGAAMMFSSGTPPIPLGVDNRPSSIYRKEMEAERAVQQSQEISSGSNHTARLAAAKAQGQGQSRG